MDSSTRADFAVGVAAGYIAGRTRKDKLALGLLSLATARALDPTARLGQGLKRLAGSTQVEQFSRLLAGSLEQRTRALLDTGDDADPESGTPQAGADEEPPDEDAPEEEPEEEAEEADEAPPAPRPRRTGRPQARKSSAHAAGPKNPPAARAKAMAQKARAERSSRKPGPKNPPAAKAMARKAASSGSGAAR